MKMSSRHRRVGRDAGLSARGVDGGRASRSRTHEPSIRTLLYGEPAGAERRFAKRKPRRGGRGFRGDERGGKTRSVQEISNSIT